MRRGWMAGVFVIVTAFAFGSEAAARAPVPDQARVSRPPGGRHHGTYLRSVGPGGFRHHTTRRAYGMKRRHATRYAALVGDPESGLGFYPLPLHTRVGAWRYRLRNQRPPWQNPVLFAIAADAARYYDWIPANRGYRYGVFNPIDGVGTPFFGGYYGPAGDDDDEPAFPFGSPYSR